MQSVVAEGRCDTGEALALGEVHDAIACQNRIVGTVWNGVAVYMLWDRGPLRPIYCGTAKEAARLLGHLKKDEPTTPPSKVNLRNPELTRFWQSKAPGWLGVSFRLFPSISEAKTMERQLIANYGIRRMGGQLFNQRLSG